MSGIARWRERIREKPGKELGVDSYRTNPEPIAGLSGKTMRYLIVGAQGLRGAEVPKGIYVETDVIPLSPQAEERLINVIGEQILACFVQDDPNLILPDQIKDDVIDVLKTFVLRGGYENSNGGEIFKVEPLLPTEISKLINPQ